MLKKGPKYAPYYTYKNENEEKLIKVLLLFQNRIDRRDHGSTNMGSTNRKLTSSGNPPCVRAS